ncbi:LCP family protein [Candidatus Uhrbacteria bacterium]|nr:LCP family protein [Candidatus Uhrbacteria bacterium]
MMTKMFDQSPNLRPESPESPESKERRFFSTWRRVKKFPLYFIVIGAVVVGLFSYGIITSDDGVSGSLKRLGQDILSPLKFLTLGADRKLKGEDRDRVNVLLLGIGGAGHEGAYLTDTIILASYQPSTKKVAMLSIPRDLVVNIKPFGWRKINSANAFGEVLAQGKGPELAAQVVTELTGQPVDYYVRVDFSGFKNLIDQFDGIDVFVDNTLEDFRYPIEGKELVYPVEDRFEHLYVAKGWQHFNGDQALKFARSRHAVGGEGSDFARSKRQQKIITAFKDKALTFKTFLQPSRLKALLNGYQENVTTNFEFWELAKLATIAREMDDQKIANRVLDDSPSGPLVSTNFNGVFILEAKVKDYSEIKKIAESMLGDSSAGTTPTGSAGQTTPPAGTQALPQASTKSNDKPTASETESQPTIEILNGTNIVGLAKQQQNKLETLGFRIIKVGNAALRDHTKTIVYQKSEQFADFGARLTQAYDSTISAWPSELKSQADFVIVLGQDLKNETSL